MNLPNRRFTIGKQPCTEFKPNRDGNGYAEWDNRHECFGPWKGRERIGGCSGTVSFCENCHKDHHQDGYETCPIPRKDDEDEV